MFRVTRSWNQTGQKFAGEPDIVTLYLAPRPALLWSLVTASYSLAGGQLFLGLPRATGGKIPAVVAGPVAAGLVVLALSFKLAFTDEDAPELVVGLARTLADVFVPEGGPGLVARARAVFLALGLAAAVPIGVLIARPTWASRTHGKITFHHTGLFDASFLSPHGLPPKKEKATD